MLFGLWGRCALAMVLALAVATAGCATSSDETPGDDAAVQTPDADLTDTNSGIPGSACSGPQSCASGNCVDGVCCNSPCSGLCEACNVAGSPGTCSPVPAGQDPGNDCEPEAATSCGRTGQCSGQRTCEQQPDTTQCAPRTCAGSNMSARPDTCDGMGHCVDAGNDTCPRAFTCDQATGQCRTSCSGNSECVAGFDCVGGQCKLAQMGTCTADTQCASGFCTDGKCCSERCDGACMRCDAGGMDGLCVPELANSDPRNECPTETAASCGRTGMCSGTPAGCALHPAATPCLAATCTSMSLSQNARSCNGSGVCADAGSTGCGLYACNSVTGTCRMNCTQQSDCATGYQCATGGVCKKSPGQPCTPGPTGDAECALGFCTDGVCCNARCNGACEACAQTGRLGFCDPVPVNQDPADDCPTDLPSSCDRTGFCNGARGCQLYNTSTVCQAASCSGPTTFSRQDSCDGAGNCPDSGTADCGIYICQPTMGPCRTTCGTNGDCASGYVCDIAAQRCKRPAGGPCSIGSECITGACCGQICRDITSDANFCGGCSTVCVANGGGNPCVNSACMPSCSSGFQNCDGSNPNGCELVRDTNPLCPGGSIGSVSGDTGAQMVSASGTGETWITVRVTEDNPVALYLSARVTLSMAAGVDFDLTVFCSNCGDTRSRGSSNLAGIDDVVNVYRSDIAPSDSFDLRIQVRYYGATMCGGWTLTVLGDPVVDMTNPATLVCD